MKKLTHGSLFSGIGGFDLAARWAGIENVFHVEKDPDCRRLLNYHFPKSKSYGDIFEFDGTPYRGTIDILSGGPPPVSQQVVQEKAGALKTVAFCGPNTIELYGKFSPLGSLLKILNDSFPFKTAKFSKQYALNWKARTTRYNRLLFQLAPSERIINGIESGFWPTVVRADLTKGYSQKEAIQLAKGKKRRNGSWKFNRELKREPRLLYQSITEQCKLICPHSAAQMMGFPEGWLEVQETPQSLK